MRPIPVSLPEPCVDLRQVSHIGATLDVLTQCHGEAGLGLAEGVVGDDLFEIDGLPGVVGDLNADSAFAGNGCDNAHLQCLNAHGQVIHQGLMPAPGTYT